MNLMFANVANLDICREFLEIANEELEHFHLVIGILEQRNIQFRRIGPRAFGRKVLSGEPDRATTYCWLLACLNQNPPPHGSCSIGKTFLIG